MKSKVLESILANQSGMHSDMVTRFQKLRDCHLIGRSRGRNAEMLSTDEMVSGVLSMVAERPGFAGQVAIGLRNLKPAGAVEDAFATAPSLAAALRTVLEEDDVRSTLIDISLGDADRERAMPTSAAIRYHGSDGAIKTTQYVPATALSKFQKGAEIGFYRHDLFSTVNRETIITARLLDIVAAEARRWREYETLLGMASASAE